MLLLPSMFFQPGDRPPAQAWRPGLGRPSAAQAGHLLRPLWPGGARDEGHQEVRVHAADAHSGEEFSLFQEKKIAHNMSMTVLVLSNSFEANT